MTNPIGKILGPHLKSKKLGKPRFGVKQQNPLGKPKFNSGENPFKGRRDLDNPAT